MKMRSKRSEKRRSSEQLNLMFKLNSTDYMCKTCTHDYDIFDIMKRSTTLPLSYENLRYHNQKSEYQFHGMSYQMTPRAPTPRVPMTPMAPRTPKTPMTAMTPSTLYRSKSLPQSHTLTPTPFPAIDCIRDSMNNRLVAKNQIPFILEDLSAHSPNSVSSYPSILALKLSFTRQASNEAISLLSPALPTPTPQETPQKQTLQIQNIQNMQNGEQEELMSSDSSFYNNEDDDDDVLRTNGDLLVPPTPRPSANHTTRRHSRHNISSNVITQKRPVTQKRKTINIISPKRGGNTRFFSSDTNGSSLLDHADTYDPPHSSVRFSDSTTPSGKSSNAIESKDDNKVSTLKPNKVPRNSQYVSYATMLQSVVEEVSDQSSLEHDIMNNKALLTQKQRMSASDASKEYRQYKQRQKAFHKIINQNKQQIQHNANSMNININNSNNKIQTKQLNIKKKKAFYHKPKAKVTTSSSLVITKNKNKNKNKNRNSVDIRRPQTSRIRVSSPILNLKKQANMHDMRLYRYELTSDDTSDIASDTTFTSTTSMTSLSNDTTQMTRSDTADRIYMNNINKYQHARRPVRIIRRAVNGINPMVRSTSAMYTQLNRRSVAVNNNKIGLFDNESMNGLKIPIRLAIDTKDNSVSEYDNVKDRDKFFLENKYRSYAGSELSFDYETIEDKLSSKNNMNHDLCKKEVHDAYERGFLAGYFLGVNIMQQQAKEKDDESVVK